MQFAGSTSVSTVVEGAGESTQAQSVPSPRRSLSLSPADAAVVSGWKRPWMSQV